MLGVHGVWALVLGSSAASLFLPLQHHQNTAKRDFLRKIELEAQQRWEDEKLFEVDAPPEGARPVLHLGGWKGECGGCCPRVGYVRRSQWNDRVSAAK